MTTDIVDAITHKDLYALAQLQSLANQTPEQQLAFWRERTSSSEQRTGAPPRQTTHDDTVLREPGVTYTSAATSTGDLAPIIVRLVEALNPEHIYLFGSHARGDFGPDSDYDLMIIVPYSAEPPYRRAQHAYAALHTARHAVDLLAWTRDEFMPQLALRASLPATVVREGLLLYGK